MAVANQQEEKQMSEWIKANQSWLVMLSMIVLFLMIIGIVIDFQNSITAIESEITSDYVTQTRYYNYNKEQDATVQRLQKQVNALRDQLSDTRVEVASNTAKINMIINKSK